jgi:hypothetical protein
MKINLMRSHHSTRGSIMVLVVAVLGLLAVIGTVYIVSSRASRNTAAATSVNINLDLARMAVTNQAQQVIGAAMIDSSGAPGGYNATAATYGSVAARDFDYPETNVAGTGVTTYNGAMRDEPWLAANLYNVSGSDFSLLSPQMFDPLSGKYDLPPTTTFAYNAALFTATNQSLTTTVVGDFFAGTAAHPFDPGSAVADGYICLLPFSEATGIRYRYGLRILDTSRMANLNTGAPGDIGAYPDTFGTNLTSLALAANANATQQQNFFCGNNSNPGMLTATPTDMASSLLNPITAGLNTGRLGTTATPFSLAGWQATILKIEKTASATNNLGLFDLTDELELRSYGNRGTTYQARVASGTTGAKTQIWPNTLGVVKNGSLTQEGNVRRANFTTYSFSREIRPYPDPTTANPPFKLTYTTANSAPTNFTTDFGNPSLGVTPQPVTMSSPANVWPTANRSALPCVAINPTLKPDTATAGQGLGTPSAANGNAMYTLAMSGTNIATAIEKIAGFSHRDACQFAANYVTSCWNGMMQDPNIPTATATAYYFPAGPSFVDESGICVRTAIDLNNSNPPTALSIVPIGTNFGNSSDLNSTAANGNIYLGYVAQPFISEIVAESISNGMGLGAASVAVSDSAVELFNPYPVALSMQGYRLTDMSASPPYATDLDLTQDATGQKLYIPANGYLIITSGTGTPALAPAPSLNVVVAKYNATFALSTSGSVALALRRPFYDRNYTANQYAVVDRASYAGVDLPNSLFAPSSTATPPAAPIILSIARADISNAGSMSAPSSVPTLGTAAGSLKINLYDRSALNIPSLGAPDPILNIADFNRIPRVGDHVYSSIGVLPGPPGIGGPVIADAVPALLTERITQLGSGADPAPNAPTASSTGTFTQANEAIIYFDFWPNPAMFQTTTEYPIAVAPPTTPVPVDPNCDMRAVVLLNCLATIDRFSDFSIDIGNGNPDITKLRIPGKINVNTASPDVLRALPGIAAQPNPDQLIANILTYRSGVAQTYGPGNTPNNLPPIVMTYAGRGFHTLGELLVAMGTGSSATIDARDKAWASIYNLCTVRSDTFVVYGYMEAVRQNPNFTSTTFNNGSHWYTASDDTTYYPSTSPTIDDPHNTGPLIRVARRRWVAIVDRSFSNYKAGTANFSLPRIVAIKDLPQ